MLPIEQSNLPEKELHASIATSLTTLCICFCLCLCLCLWQSNLPEKKLHASINPPFLPPLPRQRSLHPFIGKSKLPAIFNQRLSTIVNDFQRSSTNLHKIPSTWPDRPSVVSFPPTSPFLWRPSDPHSVLPLRGFLLAVFLWGQPHLSLNPHYISPGQIDRVKSIGKLNPEFWIKPISKIFWFQHSFQAHMGRFWHSVHLATAWLTAARSSRPGSWEIISIKRNPSLIEHQHQCQTCIDPTASSSFPTLSFTPSKPFSSPCSSLSALSISSNSPDCDTNCNNCQPRNLFLQLFPLILPSLVKIFLLKSFLKVPHGSQKFR